MIDQPIEVFGCGFAGYHTCRIPAIVRSTAGTLIAYCEGRRTGHGDWGDIDILSRRSTDGGLTWGEVKVVASEAGEVTMGNPVPIVDRDTGVIHLLCCRNGERVFHVTSGDDGTTYSSPREITELFWSFAFPDGYEWDGTQVMTGPVHGMQTRAGVLMAPIKFSVAGDPEHGTRRVGIIYSDDHGGSWKAGGIVPPTIEGLSESTLFECSDGSIVMNSRYGSRDAPDQHGGCRVSSRSDDAGLTWLEPKLIADLPDPICQGSSLSFDNKDGTRTVLFANPAHTSDRRRLTLRLSDDDGASWRISREVCEGPSGYSDIARTEDGAIVVLFEHGTEIYREKISLARFDPELRPIGR